MKRQPLLLETLLKQQITRTVPVYMYRKAVGPPATQDRDLERFFHSISHDFDLGPLLAGDQQQARQLAQDYLAHLKKRAKQAKIPYKDAVGRLKKVSPHIRRSLLTFHSYLDAKAKTSP